MAPPNFWNLRSSRVAVHELIDVNGRPVTIETAQRGRGGYQDDAE